MAKLWCLRLAGATGIVALALLLVSLDPFLSAVPSAGATTNGVPSAISVNRSLKGDRLPVVGSDFFDATFSAFKAAPRARSQSSATPGTPIPVGCDPAFSPIFTPAHGNFYGRCTT